MTPLEPDRVDAGEEDEAAVAVRTGLSRQVGDITGRLRGIVARRMVGVAGALVGQEPAAVVAFELQHGVGLEHFGDERGDARAADHHEVVAVEVHIAPELDVLDSAPSWRSRARSAWRSSSSKETSRRAGPLTRH